LYHLRVSVMVFNVTFYTYFSYIMAVSFFLVEETGVPGVDHRTAASH